mmetsp:Transcript_928/g.1859  ORF Transcript_928/g.1859 Transcript_928/m.1859 type:complete len:204 (-) Transcript_928:332-943(-)
MHHSVDYPTQPSSGHLGGDVANDARCPLVCTGLYLGQKNSVALVVGSHHSKRSNRRAGNLPHSHSGPPPQILTRRYGSRQVTARLYCHRSALGRPVRRVAQPGVASSAHAPVRVPPAMGRHRRSVRLRLQHVPVVAGVHAVLERRVSLHMSPVVHSAHHGGSVVHSDPEGPDLVVHRLADDNVHVRRRGRGCERVHGGLRVPP